MDRWHQIEELFQKALQRDPAERESFVRDACREVTGEEIQIRIFVKDPQTANEPPSPEEEARLEKQRLRETAESSPVVQQMLKTFRGEIVDVRRSDSD